MTDLRLVVFDVDGTLVDSQADILAAMGRSFASENITAPDRDAILGIVGLSLDVAISRLVPDVPLDTQERLVEGYKDAYIYLRQEKGTAESSPLYPGAMDVLQMLNAQPNVLLGVATGKSRRGLDKLIEGHGLDGLFVTQQVADHHPSKPHPSMLYTAMEDCGVTSRQCVMIGDTSYDMGMAQAAGVAGIGVSWGYHELAQLHQAKDVINSFAELPAVLERFLGINE